MVLWSPQTWNYLNYLNYLNRCWGYGSGTRCFWASRIRIHISKVMIRIRLPILLNVLIQIRSGTDINVSDPVSDPVSNPVLNPDPKPDPKLLFRIRKFLTFFPYGSRFTTLQYTVPVCGSEKTKKTKSKSTFIKPASPWNGKYKVRLPNTHLLHIGEVGG